MKKFYFILVFVLVLSFLMVPAYASQDTTYDFLLENSVRYHEYDLKVEYGSEAFLAIFTPTVAENETQSSLSTIVVLCNFETNEELVLYANIEVMASYEILSFMHDCKVQGVEKVISTDGYIMVEQLSKLTLK